MPFIFIDGKDEPQAEKRRQIRKHVMLGKNRGKTRHVKSTNGVAIRHIETSSEEQDDFLGLSIKMRYPAIPDKVGSELSFTHFADTIEPPLIHDLLKFSLVAKKVMYPLESCILFHRKSAVDRVWFEVLTYDPAYLHALIFSTQAYFLLTSGQEAPLATRRAAVHYSTALRLLRERLSGQDEQIKISDPTIFVVMCLASHAHLNNDYVTAKYHIEGLRKMVTLRGGIHAFSYNPKLIIELLRRVCDLGIAIHNGIGPLFFQDRILEPLIPYGQAASAANDTGLSKAKLRRKLNISKLDTDLIEAWMAMKRFCSLINFAAEHNRRLPKEVLLDSMASIMYRLFHIDRFDPTSTDEAVRLGLLAFSSHVFLSWQDVRLPHPYFPQTYRHCLLNLQSLETLSPQTLLWLLMVGAISLFAPADDAWLMPWLLVNIDLCGPRGWSDVHRQLRDCLWLNILHDGPARAVFERAVSLQQTQKENVMTEHL